MREYVNGWHDDNYVYLVSRDGDAARATRVRARWSAFFLGLNDGDRLALQRSSEVVGVRTDEHGYTRVDFANRWARKRMVELMQQRIDGQAAAGIEGAAILEADVNPLRRLLSDVRTIGVASTFRLGYFDLETDSRKTFAEATEGKARVLSWAITNEDRTASRVEVLAADSDVAERELLESFFREAERYDVMLAWNGDGFDFPVLRERAVKLRVKVRDRYVKWQRWCWLDAMQVFKKYNQAHDSGEERASFSLNAIAHHVLKEGKHDFDASRTWYAWEAGGEERERLVRYNLQDTELLPRIEAKTGFVALHLAVCQVTRCFPDSWSLGAAAQGDGFLLALGAERGYRFASKRYREDGDESTRFQGAYVMAPRKVGAVDNVHVCDFAGLYPSIMRSWNMSPDTYVYPNEARAGRYPVCKLPDRPTWFRTDRRGIFPIALDTLVAQRAEYTKRAEAAEVGSEEFDRYKRLSSAFKIIANSFYGIVGSPFTRYFDRAIAEGVTQTGAWLIKHVAKVSENAGLEPFYGDTDSVFVQGDADAFERVVSTLNEGWPGVLRDMGCTESRIKLEFEKSFHRLVLVSAKRYAARFARYKGKPAPDDMKPEVKGLEYKRGDTLRLAREMQAGAIAMLLRPALPSVSELREYVATWRARVLEGELALEDVILSQSVKDLDEYAERFTSTTCATVTGSGKAKRKCGFDFGSTAKRDAESCPRCGAPRKVASQPAHVRVAKILRERGEPVMAGSRIEYLIVTPNEGEDATKLVAVPAHDPGMFERIDRRYYWEDRVLAPTKRVLECVHPGVEWGEPKAAKEPKSATLRARRAASATFDFFEQLSGDDAPAGG